jgi:simple sugar transport system substrate-binding protein
LGGAIERAAKAGIPVISLNSGSDVSKKLGCLLHVGQDEYIAGKRGGERMKALGIKKAVVINQEVGNAGLDLRTRGFIDTVGSGSQILAVPTDFTAARDAVSAFLQKNPDIDAVLTLGPTGAEPVLQALEQTGKLGKVKFATFDLSLAVLQAIDNKQIDFAIDQQQYLQGYLPVVFLTNLAKYGLIPASDIVLTGPLFVTSDTAKRVVDLTKQGIR